MGMETSSLPDEVIRSDVPAADQPDAKPAEAGGSGNKTIRTAYPIDSFEHSVKGVTSPITRAGTEVPAGKVKQLLDAAKSAATPLEEVKSDA
jgi:hypothetical protein